MNFTSPRKSGAREKCSGLARKRSRPGMTGDELTYAVFSNSSRPISMRRISLVPAPIS
jgi:hypothetical protein